MSQRFITLMLNGWLVTAVILFAIILLVTFRPSARERMARNARIPFDLEERPHGDA